MVENPVQHGGCKYRISHHFCPVHDLLVGREDVGGGFVGITDEGKEPVGLAAGDRSISDLVDDEELCLLQIPQSEPCGTLRLCCVKDLYDIINM